MARQQAVEALPKLRDALAELIGARVVDVIAQSSVEYGSNRPDLGLVLEFSDTGERLVVWASQDAEGNGPGWFDVQREA